MNLFSKNVMKIKERRIIFKKTIMFALFFFIFNVKLSSIILQDDEIVIGKIIYREYFNRDFGNDVIQLENKYYVVFDAPWKIKIFDREITFDEILITNEDMEFINGIDYENKKLKIYCDIVLYPIVPVPENIIFQGFIAIFIKNIEIIN
jgi:hypothetical protein